MSNEMKAGQDFLAANATKEGVIVTASGLQYRVMKSGQGAPPGPTDVVKAHYHGTFIDGKVFDSSVERGEPLELPVNGVISGWTEALQMMQDYLQLLWEFLTECFIQIQLLKSQLTRTTTLVV